VFFKYDFVKDKNKGCLMFLIMLLYLIPSFPITYNALKYFGFDAPFKSYVSKTNDLEKKEELLILEDLIGNYENLSLKEIKTGIGNSIVLIQEMKSQETEQKKLLNDLKIMIENRKSEAQITQGHLDSLKTIELNQVSKIESILFKSQKNNYKDNFWIGILISFIVGVASSVIATWMLRKSSAEK